MCIYIICVYYYDIYQFTNDNECYFTVIEKNVRNQIIKSYCMQTAFHK